MGCGATRFGWGGGCQRIRLGWGMGLIGLGIAMGIRLGGGMRAVRRTFDCLRARTKGPPLCKTSRLVWHARSLSRLRTRVAFWLSHFIRKTCLS